MRESRRVRERSDNNNLADGACGWLDVFWEVTERDFLRRAFPSPALSVLAIKACTRHLWFKHRNEVERKGGGELRLQWRFKGGKCAGLYTSNFSLPWRCRASYVRSAGTCRGRRRPRSFGLPYPQLLSHGEQRCLCSWTQFMFVCSVVLHWVSRFSLCLQLKYHVTSAWLSPSVCGFSFLPSNQFEAVDASGWGLPFTAAFVWNLAQCNACVRQRFS